MAELVDVVVEELVDEVHVRQEHPPAAVAGEAQRVQDLAHVHSLAGLAFDVSLPDQHAELFPAVGDDLAAAEATHRDDHVEYYYQSQHCPDCLFKAQTTYYI